MLNDSFEGDHETVAHNRQRWVSYFYETLATQTEPDDFYAMAVCSFNFCRGLIQEEYDAFEESMLGHGNGNEMEVEEADPEPVVSTP